jgi:hypothetical protein
MGYKSSDAEARKRRFSTVFRNSCYVVAQQCYGLKGTWAYDAYAFINATYFGNRLPWAHILWGLTEYGSCIAWASTVRDKSRPPIITLHPALLEVHQSPAPWGIPPRRLGPSLVFDTLLHECMHVHIDYNLGGTDGRTSHDCNRWIRQVNRIAKLLGFSNVDAGRTKTVRIPDPSLPRTVRGKLATRVVRRCEGNVPFRAVSGFPSALRSHRGEANAHYGGNRLPDGAPTLSGH